MFSISFIIGVIAGIFSGLMGVGGGSIIVPALVIFYSFSQHLAQGVSLGVIIPTAIIGAYAYYKKGKVEVKTGMLLAVGSVVGVIIGAQIAKMLPSDVLRRVFGLFALFLAVRLFYLRGK